MIETIRAFLALEITEELRKEIGLIQDLLKKTGADVKWVLPKNLHLTLKFLGETPLDTIEDITSGLKKTTREISSFTLSVEELGAFPAIGNPRIIWIGIKEGKDQTIELAARLEDVLGGLGFEKDKRPFSHHLTLGRKKSGLNTYHLVKQLKTYRPSKKMLQEVTALHFIKSTLTPQGPVYETIDRFPFARKPR